MQTTNSRPASGNNTEPMFGMGLTDQPDPQHGALFGTTLTVPADEAAPAVAEPVQPTSTETGTHILATASVERLQSMLDSAVSLVNLARPDLGITQQHIRAELARRADEQPVEVEPTIAAGTTVRIDAGHLIDPTDNIATVVTDHLVNPDGSKNHDYVWLRFANGTENGFPVNALTPVEQPKPRRNTTITDQARAIADFIDAHPELGELFTLDSRTNEVRAQVTGNRRADALLAWFYRLDNAALSRTVHESATHIQVTGKFAGINLYVYTGFFTEQAVAALVDEPTVHTLRQLQIANAR
ncbi:hypothetical protein JOF56_011645 [Kibdelosporangium banguiense]|uniref:Uncharacterized protein n=1 Tax=Kibdelosporangium banguiense TaxID=1365924 RepID=A0ABS4U3M9_9PSEU|nr:hypothetical protein [Kibdelosporangium banguiense]MBP2331260.1 hypothetical protein [Kibdelosporangium banguiense]